MAIPWLGIQRKLHCHKNRPMNHETTHTKPDVYAAFLLFVLCCLLSFSDDALALYESVTLSIAP